VGRPVEKQGRINQNDRRERRKEKRRRVSPYTKEATGGIGDYARSEKRNTKRKKLAIHDSYSIVRTPECEERGGKGEGRQSASFTHYSVEAVEDTFCSRGCPWK